MLPMTFTMNYWKRSRLMLTNTGISQSNNKNSISSIFWGKCFFYALLIPALLATSCKNPDDIGLDVIPASDHLTTLYTDTLTVNVSTVREDSLRSDEVSQILLGSINDPHFGVSTASLFTQVLLGQTPSLGDTLSADSVVLSFDHSGYYGDTAFTNSIHVYRLTTDLYLDSSYYTNKYFNADSATELAASISYALHPHDSSMVDSVNQPLQLRIKMTSAFANEILALADSSAANSSNDAWRSFFKGFYIKVDPAMSSNSGVVHYFNPNSSYTKMTLYYHAGSTEKTYDFTLSNAARVNHQTHDYTGSSAGIQMATPSFNDSLAYMQAMSGLKTHISFPYLKNMIADGKIIINKAELVITVADTNGISTTNPVPSSLFLTAKDSAGTLIFVSDYLDQLISFGGGYNTSSFNYKFNIGRHLQRILDGNIDDFGFSLNIVSSVVQADRLIIGSGKGTANPAKIKLNLFYTKL
jgi:hypothetical protein